MEHVYTKFGKLGNGCFGAGAGAWRRGEEKRKPDKENTLLANMECLEIG